MTFEEQFPSLEGKWVLISDRPFYFARSDDITNACLDKQKVREVLHKHSIHDCECKNYLVCFDEIEKELGL